MQPEPSAFLGASGSGSGGDLATPAGGRGEGAQAPDPLPCLNSHKCTEDFGCDPEEPIEPESIEAWNRLTGTHRKTAFALTHNVARLVAKAGIERCLFLTLTFADHVTENSVASRRWKSFRTHFLTDEAAAWVAVRERQRSQRLHFHVVIVVPEDVRTGVDFAEFAAGIYRSASAWLRAFWCRLRDAAARYGFGRTEAIPIKSTAEGVSRYVGKYIAKNIEGRIEQDAGARLVMYSETMQRAGDHLRPNDFAWNSKRSWLWRQKVGRVALRCGITEPGQFREYFGSRWAWHAAKRIMTEALAPEVGDRRVTVYPSPGHASADGKDVPAEATQGPVTVTEFGSVESWEGRLDALLLEFQKAFAFERIRRERNADQDSRRYQSALDSGGG